jgi:hypothetical protein
MMKYFQSLLIFIILISLTYQVDSFGIPAPERLRRLLESEMNGTRNSAKPIVLPCCYDGISARLIARAGFDATFMTGFGVSGKMNACAILHFFPTGKKRPHIEPRMSPSDSYDRRQWLSRFPTRVLW